ncbi:DUF1616 domain-containing protein [Haladaptatus sp. CMSO5]|uniref:DUF1616 domain-containing protein n=1 Tax=Haladaptatus sp. CMSO5 TaxID=3120514 RepID=UPI002FCE179D
MKPLSIGLGQETSDRRLPWDVSIVIVLVLLSQAIILLDAASPVRILLSLLALAFLPGFALTTVAFPGHVYRHDEAAATDRVVPSLDTAERLALSVAFSLIVVVLTAFFISQTAFGLSVGPLVTAVSFLTIGFSLLGALRRLRVPEAVRFAVVPHEQYEAIHRWRQQTDSVDVAITLVLVVAIAGSLTGLGFALIAPESGESYTDFQLLAEENGQLIAGGYPTELVRGEPANLVFAVSNYEQGSVTYTVVVQIQRVNDAGQVTGTAELDRFSETVADGDRWVAPHTVTPETTGEDLRIAYLLYKGDAPETPTQANAYRQLYLWVTVTEAA